MKSYSTAIIVTVQGDQAASEGYTVSRYVLSEDDDRKIMIGSRQHDGAFARVDGHCYLAKRHLVLDGSKTCPLARAGAG
jgi:hypothetical protein